MHFSWLSIRPSWPSQTPPLTRVPPLLRFELPTKKGRRRRKRREYYIGLADPSDERLMPRTRRERWENRRRRGIGYAWTTFVNPLTSLALSIASILWDPVCWELKGSPCDFEILPCFGHNIGNTLSVWRWIWSLLYNKKGRCVVWGTCRGRKGKNSEINPDSSQ